MKKMKADMMLLGIVLLGIAAFASVGAWEMGSISFLGMALISFVSCVAAYQLLCGYNRLQAQRRHRAARQAYRRAMAQTPRTVALRVAQTAPKEQTPVRVA